MAYGHLPLLDDASLRIEPRERVCVIGRNGTGKSTLLQVVSGEMRTAGREASGAEPGLRIGGSRRTSCTEDGALFDVVGRGLARLSRRTRGGGAACEGGAVAAADSRRRQHGTLSGGWRRVCCSRARSWGSPTCCCSTSRPITSTSKRCAWLEEFLADYAGASCSSRTTASSCSAWRPGSSSSIAAGSVVAGRLRDFLSAQRGVAGREAAQDAEFDKRLAEEEAWLRQGIKAGAPGTRARARAAGDARRARGPPRAGRHGPLQAEIGERAGQLVIEARRIAKSFDGQPVVRDFSVRVMRGDRVGLIGPNGCGQDDAAQAAARRARARRRRGRTARTCRLRTTISSANSSTPSDRLGDRRGRS